MQQRETATKRLADVIQVIRLGRKTGTLTVERGRGPTYEEGNITFVNGQVMKANVGGLNGQPALAHLNMWGECLFAFVEQSMNKIPSVSPAQTPSTPLPNISSQNTPAANVRGRERNTESITEPLNEYMPTGGAPRRMQSIEEGLARLDQMGFSRAYRRLLLLIDGRRTIAELVRLVGHNAEEVARQLDELEQAGFIQQ